jgi:hypothetical protein
MKKLVIFLAAALMMLPAVVAAQSLDKVQRSDDRGQYGRPDIEVWTDNNDGVYSEGENVTVYFRTDRDCYVAIYGVDTRGDVNLLYPAGRWDNGQVRGGEVYTIPGDNADYDLVINGPEGMEIIQAVASDGELDIPDWYSGAPVHCDYRDDRDEFVNYVNDRYFDCRFGDCERSFARATVYVQVPRYYYKPVYVPTYWNTYPDYSMMYIDYPFGGEIYIDGVFFGIAPLWIPRVVYGHHWFTIYDRYGYCWEDQIIIDHHTTIHLDQSRVKTSRTVVSRYVDKDLRVQAKKYDRTSFVKSEERVKNVRADSFDRTSKRGVRPGGATSSDRSNRTASKKYEGDSRRTTSDWNTPRPSTVKKGGDRSGTYDKSGTGKNEGNRSGTVDRSTPSKRSTPDRATPKYNRPSGSTTPKGDATSSKSGGVKSSGSSQSNGNRSSGSTTKGSSSGSSGSTKKGSGGGGGNKSGSGKRP